MTEKAAPIPRKRKWLRPVLFCAGIPVLLIILLCVSLSGWGFRSLWLPLASKLCGAEIRAERICIQSLCPFQVEIANFHYADSRVVIAGDYAATRMRLKPLLNRKVVLEKTQVRGTRLDWKLQSGSDAPKIETVSSRSGEKSQNWTFSLHDYEAEDITLTIHEANGLPYQCWLIRQLRGDRFCPGQSGTLYTNCEVTVEQKENSQLKIGVLPFSLTAVFQPDENYCPRQMHLKVQTGVWDMELEEDIVIPREAGISVAADIKMDTDGNTLQISDSQIIFNSKKRKIGKLRLRGSLGETFRCSGEFSELDLQPYLAIFAKNSGVNLAMPRAEFSMEGTDFTEVALQSSLKARLKAEFRNISIPVELDRTSRLVRLIMIPLEAMPTFFELAEMSWSFKHEIRNCMNSISAIIKGKRNLEFQRADLELELDRGTLQIKDITLRGQEIEMETIRGVLDLPTGKIDLKTVLVACGVRLPLDIEGSLNNPTPKLRNALKDFFAVNAPLLQTWEKSLKEPPTKKDTRLEKALKRGYRNLNKYLNR